MVDILNEFIQMSPIIYVSDLYFQIASLQSHGKYILKDGVEMEIAKKPSLESGRSVVRGSYCVFTISWKIHLFVWFEKLLKFNVGLLLNLGLCVSF